MAVTVVVSATVAEKVAVRLAGGARGKIEISSTPALRASWSCLCLPLRSVRCSRSQ